MADAYSFSTKTARKRRPRKIRVQNSTTEETTDSAPPISSSPAHDPPRARSPQIEENKSPVRSPASNPPRANRRGNATAAKLDVPPMMSSSSSSDSSEQAPKKFSPITKTRGILADKKSSIKRVEMTGNVSKLGSLKQSHNAENTNKPIVKKMSNISEGDSSSDSDDSDSPTNGGKYNKYRKYLTQEPQKQEKWAPPKKKLGAPPSLEFTYRYAESGPPQPPSPKEAKQPEAPPKPVVPKSDKLSRADMATISFMLGGESDDDSASSSSGSGSHRSKKLGSIGGNSSDHQFVDGQSTDNENDIGATLLGPDNKKEKIDQGLAKNEKVSQGRIQSDSSSSDSTSNSSDSDRLDKMQKNMNGGYKETVKNSNDRENAKQPLYPDGDDEDDDGKINIFEDKNSEDNDEDMIVDRAENEDNDDNSIKDEGRRSENSSDTSPPASPKSENSDSDSERSNNNSASEGDSSEIMKRNEKSEVVKSSESPKSVEESPMKKKKSIPPSMPPTVNEDEEALGDFLDTEKNSLLSLNKRTASVKSGTGSMVSNTTDSSDDNDDFSDIWAQSVREEAKEMLPERPASVTSRDSKSSEEDFPSKASDAVDTTAKTATAAAAISNRLQDSSSSSSTSSSEKSFGFAGAGSNHDVNNTFASAEKETSKLKSQPETTTTSGGPEKGGLDDSLKMDESLNLDGSLRLDGSIDAFDFAGSTRSHDNSVGGFSLAASQDILTGSEKQFDLPEYEPKRKTKDDDEGSLSMGDFNQGLQDLDTSNFDLEASSSAGTKKSKKTPEPKVSVDRPTFATNFWRSFVRGFCCLVLLGAIGVPVYFFLFHDTDSDEAVPNINDLFPLEITEMPTSSPTNAPVMPPTAAPVGPPTPIPATPLPTASPTAPPPSASPTISTISILREFLISIWPSLSDDFIGFTSAQFKALDWLANNENIDSYSDAQIVQRFALATLYFSTLGETWRNDDLWLSDEDECLWFTSSTRPPCNEEGIYINLELDLNDLAGTIPPEIALLSNGLSRLDFSRSGSRGFLSGSIPSELGLLTELTFVNLRGNFLTGSIPTEINGWTDTTLLDLSDNALSGPLPTTIGRLTNIESLYMQGNALTGSLASELGRLTGMRYLNLADNAFTSALPSELGNVQLLETLNLERNQFTSLPSEMGRLILLRSLSIFDNTLSGQIPTEMGNMVDLLSMDLSQNFLTGTIPTEFGNLFVIRDELNLSQNALTGEIPSEFGRLIFLRNLVLHDNFLSGGVPTSFSSLNRLISLRLESNNLNETTPVEVCNLFKNTFPIFAADCIVELDCPCCMFCCVDGGDCQCQFEFTEYDFLCFEYTKSPGLEKRMADYISV